jgi:hypothetical protein
MASWTELLDRAEPEEHIVQLYGEDDQLLARNVSRYIGEGLKQDDGILLIATADHHEAISRQLWQSGTDPIGASRQGRLLFLEAQATLARFMVDGQPDRDGFLRVARGAIEQLRALSGCAGIRAFGEMVGLLWVAGRRAAAIRLEEYWNELLQTEAVSLFCAYPIDVLGGECEAASLQALLGVHSHLLAGPRTMLSSPARC